MHLEKPLSLLDFTFCLSKAVDLVSPRLNNHHLQVAYLSLQLARVLHLDLDRQLDLVFAGALHDIGGLSLQQRLDALNFEIENPFHHCELGYQFLQSFPRFSRQAHIVRHHHLPWDHGAGAEFRGKPVALESHILHLADRTVVSITEGRDILSQVDPICRNISRHAGRQFNPELVDALCSLAVKEYIWLDLVSGDLKKNITSLLNSPMLLLNDDELVNVSRLFARVVDFRSNFTATHSSGVAACAATLAGLLNFSKAECLLMQAAGYLHDLGKLAVPVEILEKPSRLEPAEYSLIKNHTYYTYRILENLPAFEQVNNWASLHHERLDGSGYPFHRNRDNLSLGSRVMAVADIFTALTEDRPYRRGMELNEALRILRTMAERQKLDGSVVEVLEKNKEEVNEQRRLAQSQESLEYRHFDRAAEDEGSLRR